MVSWFQQALSPSFCASCLDNLDIGLIPRRHSRRCRDGLVDGVCSHLHEAMLPTLDDRTTLANRLALRLIDLSCQIGDCTAAHSLFSFMLQSLVASLNMYCENMETERTLLDERPLETAQGRTMNMDVDTVDEIHAAVASGAAANCQAYARAQVGKYTVGFAQDMVGRRLSRYLASIELTFKGYAGDVGLTLDGTRAGNPAEENIVAMIWHCAKLRGAVVPIKVISGKILSKYDSVVPFNNFLIYEYLCFFIEIDPAATRSAGFPRFVRPLLPGRGSAGPQPCFGGRLAPACISKWIQVIFNKLV